MCKVGITKNIEETLEKKAIFSHEVIQIKLHDDLKKKTMHVRQLRRQHFSH